MASRKPLPIGCTCSFLSLFTCVGVCVLVIAINQICMAKASVTWPTTAGKVKAAEQTKSRGRRGRTNYGAKITYTYVIDGQTHTANRVSYGDYSSSSQTHSSDVLARYPVGATVTVHYQPDHPDTAVLEPGVAGGNYLALAFGSAFIILPSLMMWATVAAHRRNKRRIEAVTPPPASEQVFRP